MVRIRHFHCGGQGSIPGQGTEIPQAAWRGQKNKKEKEKKEWELVQCENGPGPSEARGGESDPPLLGAVGTSRAFQQE